MSGSFRVQVAYTHGYLRWVEVEVTQSFADRVLLLGCSKSVTYPQKLQAVAYWGLIHALSPSLE